MLISQSRQPATLFVVFRLFVLSLSSVESSGESFRPAGEAGNRHEKTQKRHEKSGSPDFDLASLPSRMPLAFSRSSWLSESVSSCPSTFDIPCSIFCCSSSHERRRLVDGFAALGPLWFPSRELKSYAASISGKIAKVNPIHTTIIERGGIKWNQLNIARLEYFASDRATN
jgi:hypothetical protein